MRLTPSAGLRFALLAGLAACAPSREPARPSVILISIDTLRPDHMGLYGYERDTTPFLDRFAAQCVVFDRAHSPWPWTLPAHMTMLTGLLPGEHGVVESDRALAPGIPTIPERLKATGYRTVGLYYPGWISERHGFERGFDVFRAHPNAEKAGEHLAEALDELDPKQPTFLFLHLFDVHSDRFEEENRTVYQARSPFAEEFRPEGAAPLPDRAARELWESPAPLAPEALGTLVAYYDSGIRYVDGLLERWMADLERRGWLENSLVLITSDHGESLGQRGRLDGHGFLFQEGLRVPLLMRLPSAQRAGERNPTPVQLADLAPTLLELAGLAADPSLSGHSLLSAVPSERWLSGSLRRGQGFILNWPRKLVRDGRQNCFEVDLARDPLELEPRAASEREFLELSRKLRHGDFPPAVEVGGPAPEEAADLRALGYGGEVEGR